MHLEDAPPTSMPKAKRPSIVSKAHRRSGTGMPGADAVVPKKNELSTTYSVSFTLPVTGPVGNIAEASQTHGFAYELDVKAKAGGIGKSRRQFRQRRGRRHIDARAYG